MVLSELPPWANGLIGVIVSLTASAVDAIGLNLQRRDHVQNASLPPEQQRHECKRVTWHMGFFLYVGSQVFGSTAALFFLQPAVVAPLGAASLVFNFLFAYLLVGTKVVNQDLIGTFLIILGAILVAVFGDIPKSVLTLDALVAFYGRIEFIIYFSILEVLVITLMLLTRFSLVRYLRDDDRRSMSALFGKMKKKKLKKIVGLSFAVIGGLIASQTVILTETSVRLVTTSFNGSNQFTTFTPFAIILILLFTAFSQVYCINSSLKVADAVVVVPVFFAFYSIFSFVNTCVYYNQWSYYRAVNYILMVFGMSILVSGVYLISASQTYRNQTANAQRVAEENVRLPIDQTNTQVNASERQPVSDKPVESNMEMKDLTQRSTDMPIAKSISSSGMIQDPPKGMTMLANETDVAKETAAPDQTLDLMASPDALLSRAILSMEMTKDSRKESANHDDALDLMASPDVLLARAEITKDVPLLPNDDDSKL